jgi:hypothetical protein
MGSYMSIIGLYCFLCVVYDAFRLQIELIVHVPIDDINELYDEENGDELRCISNKGDYAWLVLTMRD